MQVSPSFKQIEWLRQCYSTLGLMKKKSNTELVLLDTVYFPFKTSRIVYDFLGIMQIIWQNLLFKISHDSAFLHQIYDGLRAYDPMIAGMMNIYDSVPQSHCLNQITFTRCDYFMNKQLEPKLIEYNVTAVSMSMNSQNLQKAQSTFNKQYKFPPNQPTSLLVNAVINLYDTLSRKGVFVFVVQCFEINVIEQRLIEIELISRGITCRRLTMLQLASTVLAENGDLFYQGEPISFVYYRTGYQLCDYMQSECQQACWSAKERVAKSNAISIPSIAMELTNQKRMQAQLYKPQVLRRYLNQYQSSILESTFVDLMVLENLTDKEFEKIKQKVEEKGRDHFILKPNMEGGGHNIYGEQAYEQLLKMSPSQRSTYVLMEKIDSPIGKNVFIRNLTEEVAECIYQFSRYGVICSNGTNITSNEKGGYLVRVKGSKSNEGGVMAGSGALCSWEIEE